MEESGGKDLREGVRLECVCTGDETRQAATVSVEEFVVILFGNRRQYRNPRGGLFPVGTSATVRGY